MSRRLFALAAWSVGVVPYAALCAAGGAVVGVGLWTWACLGTAKGVLHVAE